MQDNYEEDAEAATPKSNKPRVRVNIIKRRAEVARLLARKLDQFEIADIMKVSESTISRDIKALREQWLTSAKSTVEAMRAEELAELRLMERDAALQFAATKDPRWMAERRQIKARIASLMGLDKLPGDDSSDTYVVKVVRGVSFDDL